MIELYFSRAPNQNLNLVCSHVSCVSVNQLRCGRVHLLLLPVVSVVTVVCVVHSLLGMFFMLVFMVIMMVRTRFALVLLMFPLFAMIVTLGMRMRMLS